NYPVVQLRSIDNNQISFLPLDAIAGWSDTAFTSTPVNNFPPGPALVTVFTNGIPSDSKPLMVVTGTGNPQAHCNGCAGHGKSMRAHEWSSSQRLQSPLVVPQMQSGFRRRAQ